ncbi:hypothetical protein [Pararobbsia alpina]|uniref:Uncharacterized protein n=1 Tax=Pararobbsia alpina TaxID=621374 RepID=A0A6S7B1D4_9BURK|nr:hypothetical protein [Pararobbsia alpina]CAB3784603.1 hypothetical protein LMG28138_01842 [Pararobbsia alpina]
MNTEIERAMCQRYLSGLAARDHASPLVLAELAWQRRAEIEARHQKELVEALTELVGWVPGRAGWHTDAPLKAVERAREVLAKFSDQEVTA